MIYEGWIHDRLVFQAAKRHLTQKIQSMDDKVEKQIDLSKGVKSEVYDYSSYH